MIEPHEGQGQDKLEPRVGTTRWLIIAFAIAEAAVIAWFLFSGRGA